jgi:uncharacterized protein YkwD
MRLWKRSAAITVLVLGLSATTVVTAGPSAALTMPPRMTRVERSWQRAVYTLLNVERLAHGRLPLRLNLDLVRSARYHNVRMARTNTLSHQLPNEPAFTDREEAFGYRWSTAAENCSVNPDVSEDGVLQLQRLMYHERPPGETGHRDNILSPNYRDVGIAVLIDPINHRVWMTEDFGARA